MTLCWRSSRACLKHLSEPFSAVLCRLCSPLAEQKGYVRVGKPLPYPSSDTQTALQYDPEATGHVRYHTVMKALLDSDSYAQYAAGVSPA